MGRHPQHPSPHPRSEVGGKLWGCCSITAHPEQVLDHCPSPSLAPAVESPLLLPETVELLEKTLHQEDYRTWKNLGIAWNQTRWGPFPPTRRLGGPAWGFEGFTPPTSAFSMPVAGQSTPTGRWCRATSPSSPTGGCPLRWNGYGTEGTRTSHRLPQFPQLAFNTRPPRCSPCSHQSPAGGTILPRCKWSRCPADAEGWGRIGPPLAGR